MDYRKFLGKVESAVLPYFGGASVDAASRRLRVSTPPAPGWWRFDVQGRTATAREPAEPEGLDGLPLIRGHLWGSRLVREGAVAEPVKLLPEEEPPRFSPLRARRWHDGTLVFEGLDFEGEAEGTARLLLEEGRALAEVKAVPASLRAAFGYAVLEGASRALGIRFSPVEVRGQVLSVSEGGRPAAEARLRALAAEREAHVRAVEARPRARGGPAAAGGGGGPAAGGTGATAEPAASPAAAGAGGRAGGAGVGGGGGAAARHAAAGERAARGDVRLHGRALHQHRRGETRCRWWTRASASRERTGR